MQWHQLDKTEQARYYEMAREERAKHLQMYPGWSARDNYAVHKKRKKRKIKNLTTDDCAPTAAVCNNSAWLPYQCVTDNLIIIGTVAAVHDAWTSSTCTTYKAHTTCAVVPAECVCGCISSYGCTCVKSDLQGPHHNNFLGLQTRQAMRFKNTH